MSSTDDAPAKPIAEPPKDGLIRAATAGFDVRAASDGGMPSLFGYMLRFNEWTEIHSIFEGDFLERIAPGAAKKTLRENRDAVKILFNHGFDPSIGEKALAPPDELEEDSKGVRYEGELFDTTYNRDLVPGLEAGQYGSSFKFRVTSEEWVEEPGTSAENPDGLPERTITELKLYEGGPVTFPAYEGATSGARQRSLTDHVFIDGLRKDPTRYPELDELFRGWVELDPERVRTMLSELEESRKRVGRGDAEEESERSGDDPGSGSADGPSTVVDQHSSRAELPHSRAGRSKTPPWQQSRKGTPPWKE